MGNLPVEERDTWWAFVATIDRNALLLELPGSVPDRRMREAHAARVEDFYRPGNGAERNAAVDQPAEHAVKPAPHSEVSVLEKQLAVYAARKRKKVA